MIIIVLTILAILTYVSWINIEHVPTRVIAGVISMALLVASIWLLTANMSNHYGMKKVTTTTEKTIYSAGGSKSPAGMLITQELGTKSDNYVMIYADREDGKAKAHFVPDKKNMPESVNKTATYKTANVDKATVKTVTTRWEWRNHFFKSMLGFGGEGHSLYKQKATVTIPDNTWVALSAKQAKQVTAKQKAAAQDKTAVAAQQKQMREAVQAKVAAYMKNNPKVSANDVADYTREATAEMTADAMKQMLK
ncbi:DUF4811 domain-containing protein [Weissella bombi]|uniref:DUF4811 domain-containing protein n=1 Tax=Weissella bombi TaxID=1505725 RepID=A0A1C3ZBA4_9LACO|nr:DUF4811 domain-containing protein [Weissella bombi]SCB79641.1 protein of unknown function [Weissella bombi]